jgi:hypothetical protein
MSGYRFSRRGGVLVTGLIGYVVLACRRPPQQNAWLTAGSHGWSMVPDDPPRAVNADPVPLRQAITELQAQLLAAHGGLAVGRGNRTAPLRRGLAGVHRRGPGVLRRAVKRPDPARPPKSQAGMRVIGFPKVIRPVLQEHLSRFAGPEPGALVFPEAKAVRCGVATSTSSRPGRTRLRRSVPRVCTFMISATRVTPSRRPAAQASGI